MKRLSVCLPVLFVCVLTACAQPRSARKKAVAFMQVTFPGNMPVNEKGEAVGGPDTSRFLIIEHPASVTPGIQTVQFGTSVYNASIHKAGEKLTLKPKGRGTTLNMTSSKGNVLWKVELSPSPVKPVKSGAMVVVKGKFNGRAFTQYINHVIELEADNRY